MRRLVALLVVLAFCEQSQAAGMLIPKNKEVPPLALLSHHVSVAIEDQVAVTKVEQVFRNHTSNALEATYIFPVPKDAGVTGFSMWVNGKEVKGEILEAGKAKQIYLDFVQQTLNPALLEYVGHNLLKLSAIPIPANADPKIVFTYTSVAPKENGLIQYTYPLKTDVQNLQTLDKYSFKVALKSQHALGNIYSPSHPVTVTRPDDKNASIVFDKAEGTLDRDFQLYYTAGGKDVELTALAHRPDADKKGHFLLLITPRAELAKEQQAPRDVVFVLDTSGSMKGKRIIQAKKALDYCLSNLHKDDRFAVLHFATKVTHYSEKWQDASKENLIPARKWVDNLQTTGGTAIDAALQAALALRTNAPGRTFTVVFFTDGQPTVGEKNCANILKNVMAKKTDDTRFFTFGVGNDVNASFLDQLADQTKGVSTYVREHEDIEAAASDLYTKISHPVLTNLKLSFGDLVKPSEIYPPQLPDLFHGGQLVVLGRYDGSGKATVKLTGQVGMQAKEFVYEVNFPDKTTPKPFVEDLWARRKVGYLLDQIRLNGENKELVDEVTALAKKYGITTPYTSYLIVTDQAVPAGATGGGPAFQKNLPGLGLTKSADGKAIGVKEFAQNVQNNGGLKENRAKFEEAATEAEIKNLQKPGTAAPTEKQDQALKALQAAQAQKGSFDKAGEYFAKKQLGQVQSGKLGVDLSVYSNALRNQAQVCKSAVKHVNNRNCVEVGGVWIDEGFNPKMPTVTVKAMSKAYFHILEKQPGVKDVFQLGNHLVWVTPSGTALVIDTAEGEEDLSDTAIAALFTAPKKD